LIPAFLIAVAMEAYITHWSVYYGKEVYFTHNNISLSIIHRIVAFVTVHANIGTHVLTLVFTQLKLYFNVRAFIFS